MATKGLILSKETETDSGIFAEYWKVTAISAHFEWNSNINSTYISCILSGWLNKTKYTNGKKNLAALSYNFNTNQYRLNAANPDQQIYDLLVLLPEWSNAGIDT